jgi:adenylate kinase family enzyme
MKIHLLGASGSGTSSIGSKIAELLEISFYDSDDLFWEKTLIPFSKKRPRKLRESSLNKIIKSENWLISGSAIRWGDQLLYFSDLIILLTCPKYERIQRLEKRESYRFGNRILPGNDMYENYITFIKWASSYDEGSMEIRSKQSENAWISRATCPTMVIENTHFDNTVESIIAQVRLLNLLK